MRKRLALIAAAFIPAALLVAVPGAGSAAAGAYICAVAHPSTDCWQEASDGTIVLASQGAAGTVWTETTMTGPCDSGHVTNGSGSPPWCPWSHHSLDTTYLNQSLIQFKNNSTGDCANDAHAVIIGLWLEGGTCEATSGTNGLAKSVFTQTPASGGGDELTNTNFDDIGNGTNSIVCVQTGDINLLLKGDCTKDTAWELVAVP
jgi:hypothetical protein